MGICLQLLSKSYIHDGQRATSRVDGSDRVSAWFVACLLFLPEKSQARFAMGPESKRLGERLLKSLLDKLQQEFDFFLTNTHSVLFFVIIDFFIYV
jgi:hypothetical protein